MVLGQISIYPVGEGTSVGRHVKKGIIITKESGYHYEIGALSTVVEAPDLEALLDLVKKNHQCHIDGRAKRIVIDMKVDDIRDKNATIETKKNAGKPKRRL